jgi:hypothetical protein
MLGRNMDFALHICSKGHADAELAGADDVAVTNAPRRMQPSSPTYPFGDIGELRKHDRRVAAHKRNQDETAPA